jgi:hypothetical protein
MWQQDHSPYILTKWINVENWAAENNSSDPNLLNFKSFSDKKFRALSETKMAGRLKGDYSQKDVELFVSTMSDLNSSYFAGYESIDKDAILSSEGYRLWEDAEDSFIKTYIMTMLEDSEDDNSLSLKLR